MNFLGLWFSCQYSLKPFRKRLSGENKMAFVVHVMKCQVLCHEIHD